MARLLSFVLVLVVGSSAAAQAKNDPLVTKVKDSIARGVAYAVAQQRPEGNWEATDNNYHGGSTALTVLALLNCDGVVDDPALEKNRKNSIQRGLASLRAIETSQVYVRALQTMAFAEAGGADIGIVRKNVDWLLKARQYRGGKFIGWSYDERTATMASDASNTQYAMLALWYARHARINIPRDVWLEIRDYYIRMQHEEGFWIYSTDYSPVDEKNKASLTMTVAGLCGLLIAGMELNEGREEWLAGGRVNNCGVYDENVPVARALKWINRNFALELNDRSYYHLYGLERAGRLSGLRFLGEHDWYREGCEYLTKNQNPDGSWKKHGGWDRWPLVNTDFALLFLSKGRTPVVISKLVHGKWGPGGRDERDSDWNNDRNDLRHLTDHISRSEMFGKKAVAWQTYDISQAIAARSENLAPSPEDEAAILADMLQSPILYITGHQRISNRLQAVENRLIQRYVENGGFLFAEACCGREEFDEGIKDWVKRLWPEQELTYLESTHPVWTCFNMVRAGEPYKLMGLQVGCRTVMLYSPEDLSCCWESNRAEQDARTRVAFQLGTNIVAYATGRVPPQPRLTPVQIAVERSTNTTVKRGYFQVMQIKYRSDDWQPAPKAMSNLMMHVAKMTGMDVMLKTGAINLKDPSERSDIFAAKFFYLHGRKEVPRFEAENLETLRFTLTNGGLLLADACCGNPVFDQSFRQFVRDLFPGQKLERVPVEPIRDALFTLNANGKALTADNIKCRTQANGPMQAMEPYVEGIRVNGRWVLLYSKYDLGCALEHNTSADCVGYDPASALRIATAAVLYNARP